MNGLSRMGLACTLAFLALLTEGCSADDDVSAAMQTARAILAEGEEIDSFDRISAAGVLLSGGSKEANQILAEAFSGGATLAQQAAVGALLSVPGEASIQRIGTFARQSDANLHAALQALRWAPRTDARQFVLLGLEHTQAGTQVAAFDIAALLPRDSGLLAAVEERIGSTDDSHVRGYGVYAAAAQGSARAFEWIQPLLDGEVFEREIAAASLGLIETEGSESALTALSEDSQVSVRLAAWASLSRFGNTTAADRLFEALEKPELAALAAGAIRRASPTTIEAISKRAGDWKGIHVDAAGRVLEAIGWSEEANASSALARALEDNQDELLKLQGLWAVGWRGRAEERPLAVARLADDSSAVRTMAAWAVVINSHGGKKIGAIP